MLIDSPAKIPHLLRNTSDSDFRSLVAKIPRQKNPRCLL
jgi:hypothetical protein